MKGHRAGQEELGPATTPSNVAIPRYTPVLHWVFPFRTPLWEDATRPTGPHQGGVGSPTDPNAQRGRASGDNEGAYDSYMASREGTYGEGPTRPGLQSGSPALRIPGGRQGVDLNPHESKFLVT